jgi:hypothetical protein
LIGLSVVLLYFLGFTEDGQNFGYNFAHALRSVVNL